MEARFPTLEGKTSVNRVYPNFLHPCEAELAAYLDGHQIPWLYKPLRFSLPQPLRFFNPHFLLTEDFTLLMSVRTRQGYHQIKNKYTALAETYPELPIQVTCPDGTPYQTREEYLEAQQERSDAPDNRYTKPIERYLTTYADLSPQGQQIVDFLAGNGWSLKRLSYETGVSLQTIHKALRQGVFSPKLETAMRLLVRTTAP
ncbi:MAG: hypothetical protein COX57_01145 [Alphaproteobacteria bacterium CG_4_10_14_0_2_um_filter_63_37]|nr:MAG: hypothetical protein AUJ55_00230 [Proteobacteria bacterium CG1_02_64_396]PJA25853.1 MAG: hypothetical protein COX57_01145 [Alphaproteobacteria bacterium CG_4_10_14_0_2_um_filter_63_37]